MATNVVSVPNEANVESVEKGTETVVCNNSSGDDDIVGMAKTKPKDKKKKDDRILGQRLITILSNLYLNANDRLQLDDTLTLRCATDLGYCFQHHYRKLLPDAPTFIVAKTLRKTLLLKQYFTFIQMAESMCLRSVFPGDGVFTKLIEILLVLMSKEMTLMKVKTIYNNTLKLFRMIVSTFPPCWKALRPYYVNLFDAPLTYTHKETKNSIASKKILELLFELMEQTLNECNSIELNDYAYASEVEGEEVTEVTMEHVDSLSLLNYGVNDYDWQANCLCLKNFDSLKPGERLQRLFDALEMLVFVLENDSVMWLLHHHSNVEEDIKDNENNPLVALVFQFNETNRNNTNMKSQLFKLFSLAASKRLHKRRLKIFERYITLLIEMSNTAELNKTVLGYKYPELGERTNQMIMEFFKTFKTHNLSHISVYLETIKILRLPYVRYEFINSFLQLFYFPKREKFTPLKVAYNLSKNGWQKYRPLAELNDNEADEELSREDYLDILLVALRSYSDWHGTQLFFKHLKTDEPVPLLRTFKDSRFRICAGSGNHLMLTSIEADIKTLRQKLRSNVLVSKPTIELPRVDIIVNDETLYDYRNDFKFILKLYERLPANGALYGDAWIKYLSEFACETNPNESSAADKGAHTDSKTSSP